MRAALAMRSSTSPMVDPASGRHARVASGIPSQVDAIMLGGQTGDGGSDPGVKG